MNSVDLINKTKLKLYGTLLNIDPENLTDNEINLLYYLSKEPFIQEKMNSGGDKINNEKGI